MFLQKWFHYQAVMVLGLIQNLYLYLYSNINLFKLYKKEAKWTYRIFSDRLETEHVNASTPDL